ncbi:hypothetical protein [Thiolapillus sp.]
MDEQPHSPVLVSFKGIEGIGRKSLSFLFSSQKNARYQVIDEHPDAIRIIDIDDYRGRTAWESLLASGDDRHTAPVIILGLEPVAIENGISLQKPYRPKQLLDAIESLAASIRKSTQTTVPNSKEQNKSAPTGVNERESHAFVGTTEDVDLDDPSASTEIFYDPGQFLAHHLLELIKLAAKGRKYIRTGCCDVAFYIDPKQHCIRTLVKEKNLRTFGALPIDHNTLKYHKESNLPPEIESHGFCFSYDDFLWRMVLASSRGRLPKDTDLDQEFILQGHPNLSKPLLFTHAVQISAAWSASPRSIKDVIRQLNIPQRYVFAFFTATYLMGYLTPANPSNHTWPQTKPRQQRGRRSLVRHLMKTLHRNKGAHTDE